MSTEKKPSGEIEQWVKEIISFSSNSEGWSASNICGPSNTYPQYGDLQTAWAPSASTGTSEFLEFKYETPVLPTKIEVYETYNPGSLVKISAKDIKNGSWDILWSASREIGPKCSRILSPPLKKVKFKTNTIRLDMDCNGSFGFYEIDAVKLIGNPRGFLGEDFLDIVDFKLHDFIPEGKDSSFPDIVSDVIVQVEGQKFPLHKCILSQCPALFGDLTKTDFVELPQGFSSNCFHHFLRILYRNFIFSDPDDVLLVSMFHDLSPIEIVHLVLCLSKFKGLEQYESLVNARLEKVIDEHSVLPVFCYIDESLRKETHKRFIHSNPIKKLCFEEFRKVHSKFPEYSEEFQGQLDALDPDLKIELLTATNEDEEALQQMISCSSDEDDELRKNIKTNQQDTDATADDLLDLNSPSSPTRDSVRLSETNNLKDDSKKKQEDTTKKPEVCRIISASYGHQDAIKTLDVTAEFKKYYLANQSENKIQFQGNLLIPKLTNDNDKNSANQLKVTYKLLGDEKAREIFISPQTTTSVEFPPEKLKFSESPPKWEWLSDSSWVSFDLISADILEETWKKDKVGDCTLFIGDGTFSVSLASMSQLNPNSGRSRPIRRIPGTLTLIVENHQKGEEIPQGFLQKHLNQLLEKGQFVDIELVSKMDNRKLKAHKFVLLSDSNFFKEQFLKDKSMKSLTIPDVDGETLSIYLQWVYQRTISIPSKEAREKLNKCSRVLSNESLLKLVTSPMELLMPIVNTNSTFKFKLTDKTDGFTLISSNGLEVERLEGVEGNSDYVVSDVQLLKAKPYYFELEVVNKSSLLKTEIFWGLASEDSFASKEFCFPLSSFKIGDHFGLTVDLSPKLELSIQKNKEPPQKHKRKLKKWKKYFVILHLQNAGDKFRLVFPNGTMFKDNVDQVKMEESKDSVDQIKSEEPTKTATSVSDELEILGDEDIQEMLSIFE